VESLECRANRVSVATQGKKDFLGKLVLLVNVAR